MDTIPRDDVEARVDRAIEQLYQHDHYLMEHDVHERAIAHRLACYLATQFPDWDVDCEYNKNCGDIKKISTLTQCYKNEKDTAKGTSEQRVYPDIIIHRRGQPNNLLIIEMKKNQTQNDCDLAKLRHYQSDGLAYRFALYLNIPTGDHLSEHARPDKKWIGLT